MSKAMRTILSVVLGAVFAFSLAACGSSNKESSTNVDSGRATDAETSDKAADNSIVVYFSRTNNTERIAEYIIDLTGSDKYEIEAKIPYTDDDIKYYTDCRADREQNDPTARPEIAGEPIDLSPYDVIYLGYPIWHGQAPKIMYTFVESYDLADKAIVPFCTSASSPIGSSATNLAESASNATWLEGKRFSASSTKDEVKTWLDGLK